MLHRSPLNHRPLTRRELLRRAGMGFGSLGLAGLLASEGARGTPNAVPLNPLAPRQPHFPGKAKRIIHLFMNGGPSHVDTFDPKPALAKWAGKPLPTNLRTERRTGAAFPSPFKFARHGKSGLEISDLFPSLRSAPTSYASSAACTPTCPTTSRP